MSEMIFNSRSYFGGNCFSDLAEELKLNSCTHPLILTDRVIQNLESFSRVKKLLSDFNIAYSVFNDVDINISFKTCLASFEKYSSEGCDSIICLGGTNVIDLAKVTGLLSSNPSITSASELTNSGLRNKVKIFAIPTNFDSGSITNTRFTVFDEITREYVASANEEIVPYATFIDVSVFSASTIGEIALHGVKLLAEGIEAYLASDTNLVTSIFALNGISLIQASLLDCFNNPNDYIALEKLFQASYLIGLATPKDQPSLIRLMTLEVNKKVEVNIPHFEAILLPHVLATLSEVYERKLLDVAILFGVDIYRFSPNQALEKFIALIENLLETLKIDKTVENVSLDDNTIKEIAAEISTKLVNTAYKDKITTENIISIYGETL